MSHEYLKKEFSKAYDEYADALFRHCSFRIRDRERAKELVQETFTKSWVYAASGSRIKNMKAFLYKVANNLIINETQRRRPTASLEVMFEETGFDPADDEKEAGINVDAAAVMRHVEKLEETYRTALVLRYIDELSVKEIADILNISESNVSVRIHRGLKKLKEYFETQ